MSSLHIPEICKSRNGDNLWMRHVITSVRTQTHQLPDNKKMNARAIVVLILDQFMQVTISHSQLIGFIVFFLND